MLIGALQSQVGLIHVFRYDTYIRATGATAALRKAAVPRAGSISSTGRGRVTSESSRRVIGHRHGRGNGAHGAALAVDADRILARRAGAVHDGGGDTTFVADVVLAGPGRVVPALPAGVPENEKGPSRRIASTISACNKTSMGTKQSMSHGAWHGAEKHVSNGPKLMSRLLYTSSVSGSVQVPSLSGQTGQHSPSVLIGSWQLGSSQSIWASEMVPSVHMNIEQGSLSVVHDTPSRCRTPALSVQVPSPGRVVVSVSGHTGPNVSVCRPGKRDRESRAERELA